MLSYYLSLLIKANSTVELKYSVHEKTVYIIGFHYVVISYYIFEKTNNFNHKRHDKMELQKNQITITCTLKLIKIVCLSNLFGGYFEYIE